MRRLFSRRLPWLVAGIIVLLVLGFYRFAGSAIVIDETNGVQTAVVTNGAGTEQKLYRLGRGYFYTIPQIEGAIEIRCKNGVRKQWGYVTGFWDTKLKVVGKTPCERIIVTR